MKKEKMIMIAILITIVIVAWICLALFFHAYSIGMRPTHEFSPNYLMTGNKLRYYPDPNYLDYAERVLEEYIKSFFVKNDWLLGETEKGYFAVDMKKHKTHYPLDTVEAVAEKVGFEIFPEDWADEHKEKMNSKYLRKNPHMQKGLIITNYFFGSLLLLLLALMVFLFKKKKMSSAT